MKPRTVQALALAALAAVTIAGCTVKLTAFIVPGRVAPGAIFEIVIAGTHSGSSSSEQAAAVVQLPPGFTVIAAQSLDRRPITRDDPAVLALYKAEPQHRLVAFSGSTTSTSSSSNHALHVRLQASPSVSGAQTFKVSLAAQTGTTWQINDPPNIADFARINGQPYAGTALVGADRWTNAPVYQSHSIGLPFGAPPTASDAGWTGVALGDVNGDGRDDLACLGRKDNGPHVYLAPRSYGQSWTEVSKGLSYSFSGRSDVKFGDFNRDGWLDLADANGKAWLGDGRGHWTPTTGIQTKGGLANTEGVAVADVNHDGYDDAAFSGHFVDHVQVFLSDGKGGFTESSSGLPNGQKPSNAGGHKLMMRDLNGDGHPDILWCGYYDTGLWLGDGKGNWSQVTGHGLKPYQYWGVDAADLDGDGDPDLVFGNYHSGPNPPVLGGVEIYENLGNARFQLRSNTGIPTTSDGFHDVALADFDRDGRPDILAGRGSTSGQSIFSSIEVWMNQGGFTFTQQTLPDLPTGYIGAPEGVAVGDVNGDSWPDVAVASYELGVLVWLNERTGFSRFGAGGAGRLPTVPAIGHVGLPKIGNRAFGWTLSGASAAKPAVFVMGLSKREIFGVPLLPIDLGPSGAPGCFLRVEPRIVFGAFTDGAGRATLALPIPNASVLIGAVFYGQWGIADPAANALGVAVSDGGAAKIGP